MLTNKLDQINVDYNCQVVTVVRKQSYMLPNLPSKQKLDYSQTEVCSSNAIQKIFITIEILLNEDFT